ncbi:uncharacterized protein MPTK1_7g11160 [Marchantia polymorpha subsp. ruderalis]|uniref:AB hydrolase-1 domain-containing protein n=2 Tax=Marchantia polymorpha TaxID=3197 RepID=A0AAF6BYB8_MARPO|nr:hypothetical protein MARPO_0003s0130 [Marchantia polymorpha]BBN17002.1 hypothetical protein Mp_7g11160 [Marchantia polymorpha subsp. ruderalis]|eukprot:PTQ49239.1 hypothetical protein MARPO_0003s0130 [Marchantia polymorpha]
MGDLLAGEVMEGELGFTDMDLGLKRLLVTAASVPAWEYGVLLSVIGLIWLYNILEFHFIGDALNGWRGDVVHLIHSPRSNVVCQLLSKCETLNKRYCPTPWLASPHLQTLFLHFFGRSPRINYEREMYITPDGGTIALDWVHPSSGPKDGNGEDTRQGSTSDETPTVVIVPGLTSDSSNHYVKHLAGSLSDKGWRVLVINHRGLGGVSITSDYFYNAGWTEDLRRIIPNVQKKYPKSPLIAVGTSIGANILIKYLGEEKTKTPIGGAVAICCPWDLVLCDRFISRKWVQALYNKALTTGLCEYAQLHQTALARMMDWNLLSSSRTVRDFDNHCTRHVGKYETVDTYYRRCGSSQYLEGVAVPLLCVSAEDDPICTKEAIPYDECRVNPNIILAVTKHGGHLGYFDGFGAKSIWYVRAATEFSKVLLSSSLMHQQNKGIDPASTKVGSDIDQGPFLSLGDDLTVAAQNSGISAEELIAAMEGRAETSELRPELSPKEIGPLIREESDLAQDKSGLVADSGNYVIVNDDFGGPIYKSAEINNEKGDALTKTESSEENQSTGQTTVKLQIRSFSELIALQSVLSQLLLQLRQQSSTIEGKVGHLSESRTLSISSSRPCLTPGYGDTPREVLNKDRSSAKPVIQNYSKKTVLRERDANVNSQANPAKKELSSPSYQNRRTIWLLAYIALITTVPFLGSALMVRTRGRIVQVLSRQWGKMVKA